MFHRYLHCSIARIANWAFFSIFFSALVAGQCAAEAPDESATRGIAAMTVPDGFEIDVVAEAPLVERPMLVAFDDQGRLYVCESAGVNLRGKQLAEDRPHSIRMLEDTDGDGRFDRHTLFADKMVFPQGIAWHDGSIYCSSPPSFWRLTDTDGDGTADEREELVTGFANTGVADDMHGGSLGPDGRIYWCAGRFPHKIQRPGGPVIHEGTAPLVLRCRPDGSDVEVVCGSQGNAVGVAFTHCGDMFASGTFLAPDSMGAGLRDAVIHCVDGGEYPVRGRDLNEHKRTGDLLPPLTHLGVSAASDLMVCRGGQLGEESLGDLFSAQFNLHKVLRHRLQRAGATFTCRNQDFLVSSDSDFHPTDVLEDADGSLLVVDTGGWFRIGCPTSQVSKPQVLGAIYRVRRAGQSQESSAGDDPRGLAIDWSGQSADALADLLADARFAVRDQAVAVLARHGDSAVPALRSVLSVGATTPTTRCAAIWALTRIETPAARAAVRTALQDKNADVRRAAARSAGLHRDASALNALTRMVTSDDASVRREAATALGRIGDASAVPALLAGLEGAESDRFLEHALIFALIEIGDRTATLAGLELAHIGGRRGAVVALDQMDDGRLTPDLVTPLLSAGDPLLRQTALWVIAHHREWGDTMVEFFRDWLTEQEMDAARRGELEAQLVAFAADRAVQRLIAATLLEPTAPRATRLLLLEAIGQAEVEALPEPWIEALRASLASDDEQVVRQTVAALRMLPLGARTTASANDPPPGRTASEEQADAPQEAFDSLLAHVASDASNPNDLRVQAAAAVAPRLASIRPELFEFLVGRVAQSEDPLVRLDAAEALSRAALNSQQLRALCDTVADAGVLEVPRLVRAFEHDDDVTVGKALVATLSQSPGRRALQPALLETVLANYPSGVRAQAEPLFDELTVGIEQQRARLASLSEVMDGGDVQRGRELFFANRKAICATCHAIGGRGGAFGPDLTKIGAIRAPRDLLEAIVLPSASFARGYEPFNLVTADGRVLSGIISRETADAIHLVNSSRVVTRVPRSDVESIAQSTVSIMPEGMHEQLSRQELADLIAFLHSLR